MHEIWQWVESHPYLSAGGGLLSLVLLYLLFSGGSSSSTAIDPTTGLPVGQAIDPNTGLPVGSAADVAEIQAQAQASSQQLAASTVLQQGQQAAQVQSDTVAAQLAAVQIEAASQDTANNLAAQVAMQQILSNADVSKDTNATQLAEVQLQAGQQVTIAGINANEAIQIAGGQDSVMINQQNDALRGQQSINAATVSMAASNNYLLASIFGKAPTIPNIAPTGAPGTAQPAPIETTSTPPMRLPPTSPLYATILGGFPVFTQPKTPNPVAGRA